MPTAPARRSILRRLATFAGVVVAGYGGIAGLLWGLQARLLFQPTTGAYERTPADIGLPWRELRLTTPDGAELAGWYVEPPAADAPAVLFFHGNAGDMSYRLERMAALHRLGLAVLMIDYRGYGTSTGTPSEAGLLRDARTAWRWLTREAGHPPERTIVQGRSLGAAVAAQLAAETRPAALVLESAFTSLPALAADLYPFLPARRLTRFDFDTAAAIERTRCPVVVAHSPADEIVPVDHGRSLARIRPAATTFVALEGGHNDRTLVPGSAFQRAMQRLVARLERPPGDA